MEGVPNKTEEEIYKELDAILDDYFEKHGPIAAGRRIETFVLDLNTRFPKEILYETKLFHLIIFSTIGPRKWFDLPGGIIEKFIREEL